MSTRQTAHSGEPSPTPRGDGPRLCRWCRRELPATARADAEHCGQVCRQAAFRLRRRRATDGIAAEPGRFAYADPPYPGTARRYYQGEPTFAGEVDHVGLIASLVAARYTGWALSTSAKALRDLLPLCPLGARVCPWVKPGAVPRATHGLHNAWEPLIVVAGRQRQPGRRDWLRAHPARRGGTLPGRKPLAFVAWLFDCLGMQAGDELVDLFPGTGIVSRAWGELSPRSSATGQLLLLAGGDVSLLEDGHASPAADGDGRATA